MSEGHSNPACFLCAAVSAKFLIKGIKTRTENLFTHLNLLLPIMCKHSQRKPSVKLNDRSWTESLLTGTTSQTSPFHSSHQRAEWDMEFHWEKKRALWSYYESRLWSGSGRVGTVSEGMSRLARLVLLQRRGCVFDRIHLRIEISCRGVIPLSVHGEADKSLGQCFFPKGVVSL